MEQLFEPHFGIIEAKLIKMKTGNREIGNYFFMEKM